MKNLLSNTAMAFKIQIYIPAFIVSLACVLFTFLFFGFYYSEYEGLNTALLSSSLTPGVAFRSVYFSGNLVISWFYSFFYEYLPGIQWISWFEYLWMFIACFLSLLLINQQLPNRFSSKAKIGLMILIYLLVFADHQVHLIYTRVAYLVCGFSLISLVVFFANTSFVKKKWWLFILLNLFFGIGTLIRNEAAIACFLLIIPFALFYNRDLKRVLGLLLLPMLFISSQSLFLAFDIKSAGNEEFYKQVEPDIEEQFIARRNTVNLSEMSTRKDSVMYMLARELSFSDPHLMTPQFLRSLIQPEMPLFMDAGQWKRVFHEQKSILLSYWYLVLILLTLGVALYVQINFKSDKYAFYYWLLFVLSFWGLTIAQTYVDKVNERSWLPYIGIFIFCHVILLLKTMTERFSAKLYPLFFVIIALTLIHLFQLKNESNRLKNEFDFQKLQFEYIKQVASDKILVINSSCFNSLFLSTTPFQLFDFSVFKNIYITDSYILPFLPYYRQYLEKECDCNMYDYPSIWKYIKSKKEDIIIVSTPERMNAIKQYNLVIHNLNLELKSVHMPTEKEVGWNSWVITE